MFLPKLEKTLKEQNIDFHIFIIEQNDEKPFNRAKLLNVGFDSSRDFDYFIFHDVDMLPIDGKCDYKYESNPTHLASIVEQFGWNIPYNGYFGGVTLFDKKSFEEINGYSNEYWGWGAEDDDILRRCYFKNIEVKRKACWFNSLNHERNVDENEYASNLKRLQDFDSIQNLSEGLSTLEYEVDSNEELNSFTTLIKVIVLLKFII